MIAPKEMTSNNKDDIEEQVHGKITFMGKNTIDQSNASQVLQKVEEEQRQAYIEDSYQVSKKIEHPLDPIVRSLPKNSIRS